MFYAATGVWSLLSMRTFERVTGPKTDRWLVKTVGALIAVIGIHLLRGARSGCALGGASSLGASSAAVLATVDVIYVARGRIALRLKRGPASIKERILERRGQLVLTSSGTGARLDITIPREGAGEPYFASSSETGRKLNS